MRYHIGIIVLFAALSVVGCGKKVVTADSRPKEGGKESGNSGATPGGDGLAKVKPEFTLEATALADEFRRSKTATVNKYKGKVVEVRGVIKDVGRDATGERKPYIELEAADSSVFCYTADADPWMHCAPGQRVTLRGRWPNFAVLATLAECALIDGSGERALEFSADKLSHAFADDLGDRYDGKRLFIRGEVRGTQEHKEGDAFYVGLDTDGDVPVYCVFSTLEQDVVKTLKSGQKIKVFARVRGRTRRSDTKPAKPMLLVELDRCILVK